MAVYESVVGYIALYVSILLLRFAHSTVTIRTSNSSGVSILLLRFYVVVAPLHVGEVEVGFNPSLEILQNGHTPPPSALHITSFNPSLEILLS